MTIQKKKKKKKKKKRNVFKIKCPIPSYRQVSGVF